MPKASSTPSDTPTKRVTYVEFKRENGVQLLRPNGKFLRYVQEPILDSMGASLVQSDYTFKAIGITDIRIEHTGLVFVIKDTIERHFPFESIQNYTVE